MKIAVRFRYYKPVTPSYQIVELDDKQWREFLNFDDATKRHDYMVRLLGKEYLDTKELWWIPIDDIISKDYDVLDGGIIQNLIKEK